MYLQAFLLDKNNRVLTIGNPIYNPDIKKLYLALIQGKPASSALEELPTVTQISVSETEHDFGPCDWEQEQTAVFKIKNTGQKPLVIHTVQTSCDCVTVDYTKPPVKPGGEAEVRATFKAEQPGYFRKTLWVRCNTEEGLVVLRVSGDAE